MNLKTRLARPACRSILILLVSLGGCAPVTERAEVDEIAVLEEQERQRAMVLRRDLEHQQRLSRVAYPILRAARPLCQADLGRRAGVNISNIHAYPREYRPVARREFGLDDHLRLLDVTPDSAAARAGLEPGDVVIEINGKVIRPGRTAVASGQRQLDKVARSGDDFRFLVDRDGHRIAVEFKPETICYYPVFLLDSNDINAYADGESIYVTRGMLRFADSDQELAQVIAHELAHNAMGHLDAKRASHAMGSILDIAAAAYGIDTYGLFGDLASLSYSQEFEAEADYVGLYAMARADIPFAENADFWRRMANENPSSIEDGYLRSHPSTAERFVAIDNTVAEVIAKQQADAAIMPNLRRPLPEPKRAPRAFHLGEPMQVTTMSGAVATLAAGCWSNAGELRVGTAYRPDDGGLSVGDRDAALVMQEGEVVGLWQIQRQRLLKLDGPLEAGGQVSYGFDCEDLIGAE